MKYTGTTTIDELRAMLAEELRRATADYEGAVATDRFFFLPPVPDPGEPDDPDAWCKREEELHAEIELTERALHRVQAAQQALEDALAKVAALTED